MCFNLQNLNEKKIIILIKKIPKQGSALSEEFQMTIAQSSVACESPVKPDQWPSLFKTNPNILEMYYPWPALKHCCFTASTTEKF